MFCKNCGAKNSKKTKYCKECGTQLFEPNINANYQASNSSQPETSNYGGMSNAPQPKKMNVQLLTYITVAILMIIVLILGGMLIFGNNKNKDENTGNSNNNNNTNITEEAYKQNENKVTNIEYQETNVGDEITFGTYEQDNNTSNGKEDIEWLVLDKKDGKALVISKYALDCKRYNETYENITWEDCTLREWLNDDFLNTAFSANEQAAIQKVTVPAEDNTTYNTDAGNDTQDKIFLLNINEANKYFDSDDERICYPTEYAKAQGVCINTYSTSTSKAYGACWWWLRSPGYNQGLAAYVDIDGYVYSSGNYVNYDYYAVRPALWITLDS